MVAGDFSLDPLGKSQAVNGNLVPLHRGQKNCLTLESELGVECRWVQESLGGQIKKLLIYTVIMHSVPAKTSQKPVGLSA